MLFPKTTYLALLLVALIGAFQQELNAYCRCTYSVFPLVYCTRIQHKRQAGKQYAANSSKESC